MIGHWPAGNYCPSCESAKPVERCFAASKELWGYSWHCTDCGWRGLRADRVREDSPRLDERDDYWDREPFTDWPNGQGTYD